MVVEQEPVPAVVSPQMTERLTQGLTITFVKTYRTNNCKERLALPEYKWQEVMNSTNHQIKGPPEPSLTTLRCMDLHFSTQATTRTIKRVRLSRKIGI